MSSKVIRLLEETGSFVKPPTGKGRPRLRDLPVTRIFCRGQHSVLIARTVYEHVFRLGDRRGDFMRAVRLVAAKEHLNIEIVKRYATRHASLVKTFALHRHEMRLMYAEMETAYQAIPRDVRESLPDNLSYSGLLALAEEYRRMR